MWGWQGGVEGVVRSLVVSAAVFYMQASLHLWRTCYFDKQLCTLKARLT